MSSEPHEIAGQQAREVPIPPAVPRTRTLAFAAQELRLISALVLLLAIGLVLALPFVLSIGSVVFLPLVSAIVLSIVLSPLADKLSHLGLPNVLASLLSLVVLIAILVLALLLILRPAIDMFDSFPAMIAKIGEQFRHLRSSLSWVNQLNEQVTKLTGPVQGQKVVVASPSVIEELAFATPSVVVEVLLTFLMAFFMIESRVRMRHRLMHHHSPMGTSIKAMRVMRDVQDRVAAYILTVTLVNVGVGIVVTFGAWAMGMQAPIMWGGLAALLNFLPYVGPLAMICVLALFGLGTSDSMIEGLIPAFSFLCLHAVESNAITPSILGARFTMNPVMILLALSYFSWIWGVPGALLSVPILLTLTAMIDHLGRPNLVGFLFGEPLFTNNPMEFDAAAAHRHPPHPSP
ncbi:MAG TPA: AI-2E family transporter [Sphingomonadaceae bacterium]